MNHETWLSKFLKRRGPSRSSASVPAPAVPSAPVPPSLSLWDKLRLARFVNNLRNDKAMLEKLKSRKLWVAVLGSALVALGSQLGLPEELTLKVAGLLGVYIIGESAVDFAKAKNLTNVKTLEAQVTELRSSTDKE